MILMCYTVLGGNVDVTLRHWSGQTSKPRIWQAIELSEFNGVIQVIQVIQSLSIAGGMMESLWNRDIM